MGENMRCDLAGAYEIVSDCFRVLIIEEILEQGNSTPKVNEVEYSISFRSYRI